LTGIEDTYLKSELEPLPEFIGADFVLAKYISAILGFFVQIDSHGPRIPMTLNFGCGHASRRPLSNLRLVTARLKWPERRKKANFFVGNVEILGVSRQILAGVEMLNLKKGSRITPPVDLNENPSSPETGSNRPPSELL
jgi:hypothetical protein